MEALYPGNMSQYSEDGDLIMSCGNITRTLSDTVLVIATVAYALLFFLGVSGNALVAFVIWKNVDMRSSTNYFLVNLCIADLLVLIVCMPSGLLETFMPQIWLLGRVMCKYLKPFYFHAVDVSRRQ